ncbi:hypothetical protein CDV31_015169 [Fusarium ambrosium]|uniref:Uncharacterized protein n=1 Tax=Fusarium ambrosium TaxID=131363 RepID=A0A428SRK9_9HYPO|nr:hypothetical protein CDV31_015169 [Fusarium ambrosium]
MTGLQPHPSDSCASMQVEQALFDSNTRIALSYVPATSAINTTWLHSINTFEHITRRDLHHPSRLRNIIQCQHKPSTTGLSLENPTIVTYHSFN